MDRYRIFVSYSHKDYDLAARMVDILDQHEDSFLAIWDRRFLGGSVFSDQIKTLIAHAHVFLPIITEASLAAGWVHQEVGYAVALNVPVLPVCRGKMPEGLLQQLHAVSIDADTDNLEAVLDPDLLRRLIEGFRDPSFALHQCADLQEERAVLIAQYCKNITGIGYTGRVRQKGGLTSFNIPSHLLDNAIWGQRYGRVTRGLYHCKVQRYERIALEEHARREGCRLIVYPDTRYKAFGPEARIVRLQSLLDFLKSMPDELVHIALVPGSDRGDSVTIVGDWFIAETVTGSLSHGYRQTIFSRHAPSIADKIESFDQEFDECLSALGWTREGSRARAVADLAALIGDLTRDLASRRRRKPLKPVAAAAATSAE